MRVQDLYRGLCWVCFVWVAFQVVSHQSIRLNSSSGSKLSQGTALSSSSSSRSSKGAAKEADHSQHAQRLVDWLLKHKAVVNVNVAYAGPGRGNVVLAKNNVTRGDVLTAIPTDLCWVFEQHGAPSNNLELAAVNLIMEMSDPDTFWQPFFNTLPSTDEWVCPLVTLPVEYIPLLQSEPMEMYLQAYQGRVDGFWREVVQRNEPDITLDIYRYARSVLITRMFGTARHGNVLVPLMHLANHANDCPNFYTERPCPNDPTRSCMVWMAGTYLAPGAEICNSYKYMPNDKAMLQYGFLQDGPISEHLHLMDAPDFNGYNMWALHEGSKHGPQHFNGTTQQMQRELERLSSILGKLFDADERAASAKPAPADADGHLLGVLQRWRQQRKAALEREIARLREQIAARSFAVAAGRQSAKTAVAAAAAAAADRLDASDRQATQLESSLFDSVRANGGMVGSITIGAPAFPTATLPGSHQQPLHLMVKPGLYAAAAVEAGAMLAAVPLSLSLPLRPDKLRMDVTKFWKDIHHPRSPRAPYFTSMLGPSAGVSAGSVYDAAVQYMQSVGHKQGEALLRGLNPGAMAQAVRATRVLQQLNVTSDELLHVLLLVAPRLVMLPQGSFLIPVIDAARHSSDCRSSLELEDCSTIASGGGSRSSSSSSSSMINTTKWCVILRAGTPLQAGDEVCLPTT